MPEDSKDTTQDDAKKAPSRKFPREQVLRDAHARWGVEPFEMAGALSAEEGDSFTDSQVTRLVSSYQRREVPFDNQDEG